ncbi:pantoate--beta-alanine ligase [Helicobacter pametensis]|uniref:pantoate--beta-alanine ligase n=1 Tax=Helicobacter pametensis TaxID=95149 RepID=UPI0004B2A90F|nr:pantoate--beta-alanine ligase [Helicobacter pametensis]
MKRLKIFQSKQELREWRENLGGSLGFVPTMGALHAGHLSLAQKSLEQNTHTLFSIFVNPTQFGANEDFDKYPKTLDKDIQLAQSIGVDAIFAPNISEMYEDSDPITLNPPKLMGSVYEGSHREGHFAGVLQIVLKLLMLTQAKYAYFGRKDAQQLLLIQKMVKDFFIPTQIIPCPIVRDIDGLALSSRNIYLTQKERQDALQIPQTLQWIQESFLQGERDTHKLRTLALERLDKVKVDYLAFCDHSLQELPSILPSQTLVLLTAKVGNTRLLDNLWL